MTKSNWQKVLGEEKEKKSIFVKIVENQIPKLVKCCVLFQPLGEY
jgi:hypothetical protein